MDSLICKTPSKPPSGKTAESNPVHHCTPSFDHPLSPNELVLKTNSLVLIGVLSVRTDCNPDEEDGNMRKRADIFDCRQQPAREDVDDNWDGEDGPGEEGAVPALVDVSGVIEDDQALDHGAEEEGGLGAGCDTGEDLHTAGISMFNDGAF